METSVEETEENTDEAEPGDLDSGSASPGSTVPADRPADEGPGTRPSLTLERFPFRAPGERPFSRRARLLVSGLGTGVTEESLRFLFKKYGRLSEAFVNAQRGCGLIRLESRALGEIARAELDGRPLKSITSTYTSSSDSESGSMDGTDYYNEAKTLQLRFAPHGAALSVANLSPCVSNELLEQAFVCFGPVERAVVIADSQGRSTGRGRIEFASSADAREALRFCRQGVYLLTACLRPIIVEPIQHYDDEDGIPESRITRSIQFYRERGKAPRFAEPGTLEFEYATRWKALDVMETHHKQELLQRLQEARGRLEAEMEAAYHERQAALHHLEVSQSQEVRESGGMVQQEARQQPQPESGGWSDQRATGVEPSHNASNRRVQAVLEAYVSQATGAFHAQSVVVPGRPGVVQRVAGTSATQRSQYHTMSASQHPYAQSFSTVAPRQPLYCGQGQGQAGEGGEHLVRAGDQLAQRVIQQPLPQPMHTQSLVYSEPDMVQTHFVQSHTSQPTYAQSLTPQPMCHTSSPCPTAPPPPMGDKGLTCRPDSHPGPSLEPGSDAHFWRAPDPHSAAPGQQGAGPESVLWSQYGGEYGPGDGESASKLRRY
uniref:paraspeckle component 1-like isoform X1 n=2 Tax=Myxine glutinosa TaxID=7769 RepID=UPI00358F12E3